MGAALAFTAAAASVAGGIGKAASEKAGMDFKASQDKVQARNAEIAADQTDAQMRENLAITLGHIKAVRASAGTDPFSPTGDALLEGEKDTSDRERLIRVSNLEGQAAESRRSADFHRQAGRAALLYGSIGAVGSGAKMLAAR